MCLGNIKDKIFDKEETSKISNLFNNFTYLTDTKNFNIIMKIKFLPELRMNASNKT